jgi:hypothetical protein
MKQHAAFLHPQRLHLYLECQAVDTERVDRMSEKPDLYLKSSLARIIGTDPRVNGLKNAEPVAYLISATGRRLLVAD